MDELSKRIAMVRQKVNQAAQRSARAFDEIRILCASKSRSPEEITEALSCGLNLFGENRIQEARVKIPRCPTAAHWHFIGHLQSNKVRDAVTLFETIQSLDSLDLAESLNQAAEKQGKEIEVYVEVNISGESSKYGVQPSQLEMVVSQINQLNKLRVSGLMSLAPFFTDPEKTRPYFAKLRECRDQAEKKLGISLPELSMGMSHDFEQAILEGSTMIRIGTAIFGERRALGFR